MAQDIFTTTARPVQVANDVALEKIAVQAPQGGEMLAYLMNPGTEVMMPQGFSLANVQMVQEGGNLRLDFGQDGQVLLLDFMGVAQSSEGLMFSFNNNLFSAQDILAQVGAGQVTFETAEAGAESVISSVIEDSVIANMNVGQAYNLNHLASEAVDGGELRSDYTNNMALAEADTYALEVLGEAFGEVETVDGGYRIAKYGAGEIVGQPYAQVNESVFDVEPAAGPASADIGGGRTVISGQYGGGSGTPTVVGADAFSQQSGVISDVIDPYAVGNSVLGGTGLTGGGSGFQPAEVNTVSAVNDVIVTNEDSAITVNVTANDSDAQGDAFSVTSIVNQPANGTVTLNANGTVTFTPNANFNGTDSFVYEITDTNGATDTATAEITVTPVNDGVNAVNDALSTNEDAKITINPVTLLANDNDPDGDAFSITSVQGAVNGTVQIDANGNICFEPNPGYSGPASFTYTITDANGATDTATVNVTVNAVNDGVIAIDDAITTAEDTNVQINVLPNDSDPDGDAFSVTTFTQPANGQVVQLANGTFEYNPDPNFNGTDTFTYTITDAQGATDTATVTITVTPVNDAPIAVDDAINTQEDVAVTLAILPNDSDPEGQALTITSNTQPANGSVVINADGTATYTPNNNFNGVDTFTYTIVDTDGLSDTATVTINVGGLNDNPIARDDTVTTNEDTAVTITVLGNDTDADGDTLSTISTSSGPSNGSVVINADGTITYTPNANFTGVDTFEYTIDDGNGGQDVALVTVTITPENDAPVAVADVNQTSEDTPITLAVLNNDTDVDGDALSVKAITSQPANGSVTVNADGTITYTPNNNFNGVDTFEYCITDGNGGEDTTTVSITVGGVNDLPVAVNDSEVTPEDTPVTINVLPNDSDPDGDALTVVNFGQPANGSVTQTANGTFVYTPNNGYNGTDQFTYEISDGNGGSATAVVDITITPVNDLPTARDDVKGTNEDTAVTINILGNDTDPENDALSVKSITDQPDNGSVVINADGTVTYTPNANFSGVDTFEYCITDGNGGEDTATVTINIAPVNDGILAVDDNATVAEDGKLIITPANLMSNDSDPDGEAFTITSVQNPQNGTVSIDANGNICFEPAPNYNGPATFEYTITDASGATDTATVNVNVTPVGDGVNAVDDGVFTNPEDTVVVLTPAQLLGNDTNPDGTPIVITSVSNPVNGTVTLLPNGNIQFTPNADYVGHAQFDYSVQDGENETDSATVQLEFTAVNDGVNAVKDQSITNEDTPVTIAVLGNDSDPDGENFAVQSITQPANGTATLNADGTVTYTPNANFNGSDEFTYTIVDSSGATDTATVCIDVTPVGDGIDAVNDVATIAEDGKLTITPAALMGNDTNPDGTAFTVTSVQGAQNGTVSIDANGNVCFEPAPNYNGPASFTYTITDAEGETDTATVNVNVTPVGDGVDAVNDTATVAEDGKLTITPAALMGNDTNPDGTAFTVTSVQGAQNGTVSIDANGNVCFEPAPNYNGPASFTYTITDAEGETDTATVNVNVTPVGDGLNAVKDVFNTTIDANVNGNVTTNDSNPDGTSFSVSANGQPANGSVSMNANGTFTYNPDPFFVGQDTFTYTITDAEGETSTAEVCVNVSTPNQLVPDNNATGGTLNGGGGNDVIIGDGTVGVTTTGAAGTDTYNVVIAIDNSCSMSEPAAGAGTDRMTLAKQTATGIIDQYPAGTTFTVVIYNSGVATTEYGGNAAAAKNAINAIQVQTSNHNSYYDDALNEVQSVLAADVAAKPSSAQHHNELYFIGDDGANAGHTISSTTGQRESWNNFTSDNGIESHGIVVGNGESHRTEPIDNTEGGVQVVTAANQVVVDIETYAAGTQFFPSVDSKDTINGGAGDDIIFGDSMNVDWIPGVQDGSSFMGLSDYLASNSSLNPWGYSPTNQPASFNQLVRDYVESNMGSNSFLNADNVQTSLGKDDILNGGAGNDIILGQGGDDTIDGGAGADAIYAGHGLDTIVWDAADTVISGGSGQDTLKVNGAGIVDIRPENISQIEIIDLDNGAANTLKLDYSDVIDVDQNFLMVQGDSNDTVEFTGNQLSFIGQSTFAGTGTFNIYANSTGDNYLMVESGVSVTGI